MNKLWNVSTGPHVRSRLTTGSVMYDVILSLIPATVCGVYHFGPWALTIVLVSVLTAVLAEYIFDFIVKKPSTIGDGSAVVTGLLLALCLPPRVPLYVPFLGSLFAILFVKSFFGGLGKNFMNPALAGRCFLLVSFGKAVTDFSIDGVSGATPLIGLRATGTMHTIETFLGYSTGVIGGSILALLIGGIFLLIVGGITCDIPAAAIVSFGLFIAVFGGKGFDLPYIAAHICGGGIVMGAFFMATDPVTSPVTRRGQWMFGALVGILSGIFRIYGSATDSVSYAIIISNMVVPLIDEIAVPVPFGNRKNALVGRSMEEEKKGFVIPKQAIVLCVITLVAGALLSGVYGMTKATIEEQQMKLNAESYREVCPDAADFKSDENLNKAIEDLGGEVYGADYGKAYINSAVAGVDDAGNIVGYVISATTGDGYEGNITMSVGIAADGTVNGISFTELNETAGMGMLCGEDAFKGQFAGVKVDAFKLNKAGGSTADDEIDTVSGASTSSGAIVNAVNAALDFYSANVK